MFALLLFALVHLVSWLLYRLKATKTKANCNVLFVTAHPDDELMFFGPTLLNEIRARVQCPKRSQVHLLCLSRGNFYGDGNKRVEELDAACSFLLDYCQANQFCHQSTNTVKNDDDDDDGTESIFKWKVIDDGRLADSPALEWPHDLIRSIVEQYVNENNITKVVTFDQYGISGHSNHIAISQALVTKSISNNSVQLWQLRSVRLWRKYLSIFDLLFTCIQALYENCWTIQVVSLVDYLYLVQALRRHHSQMLWFRYLYSSTSRYMFINCLTRPKVPKD